MSKDPKAPASAPSVRFPSDEMSTGETSSMLRRAHTLTGAPDRPQPPADATLKPMTGAQLAFRPSAPPRPATGAQPAYKPKTGTQPAFKPTTGAQPAFKPATGQHAAFRPSPSAPTPAEPSELEGEPPVFDAERLQAQIRALSMTDSALGRAAKAQKPLKSPTSAAEDTFVKARMKQAEAKVPDFDLDEDLG